jgi:hypothetical protein
MQESNNVIISKINNQSQARRENHVSGHNDEHCPVGDNACKKEHGLEDSTGHAGTAEDLPSARV